MIPHGPNWYASVMGTGILAVVLADLPFDLPGASYAATVAWLLALGLLVAVTVVGVRSGRPLAHLGDPVLAHFYGATAMGLMTAGAATGAVGGPWLGRLTLPLEAGLWVGGTLLGLATAVVVPYWAITVHGVREDSAFGGWLMPVVPPMVSAATGTALLGRLPAGEPRATLFALLCAAFGIALLATLVILPAIWQRVLRHGPGAPAAVPTLWIVLGPLGQAVTAAYHLTGAAPLALPGQDPAVLRLLFLAFGLPVWGFALLWLSLAAALTVRQVRAGLPFAPTWWSFTFPVGTLVTGTTALAHATGLLLFAAATAALLVLLLLAWAVVAVATTRALLPVRAVTRPARDNGRTRLVGSSP
ncbi:C4-dicarboxylate ABC transporter [Nocardioides sp. R1-1]|uniref:SLAC1 family transporter n=1 Tax=Nocardioides sp. R1-1 TaxID=3383502 RepID=UPI0038D1BA90